jgi:hypothetical protein
MTIERTMRLVCNGDTYDRSCEGASGPVGIHDVTATTLRRNMHDIGWTRVGLKDYCGHCSLRLEKRT